MGWLVRSKTASPLLGGVAAAAGMAPFVFLGILSGAIADRVDRRLVLRFVFLGGSLVSGLMAFLLLTEVALIWHIIALAAAAGPRVRVHLPPHLAPLSRGILATIDIRLAGDSTPEDAHAVLAGFYEGAAFVRVLKFGELPSTRHVAGSNHCLIGVVADRISGRVVVVSVLDNLVKGASGQAIQNMNLIRALPETLGLEQLPMFP